MAANSFLLFNGEKTKGILEMEDRLRNALSHSCLWVHFEIWVANLKTEYTLPYLREKYGGEALVSYVVETYELQNDVTLDRHRDNKDLLQCPALWYIDFLESLYTITKTSAVKNKRPRSKGGSGTAIDDAEQILNKEFKRAKAFIEKWGYAFEKTPKNNSDRLCLLCCERERNVVFDNCRHFLACDDCARKLSVREVIYLAGKPSEQTVFPCPSCRKKNHSTEFVYFS